jgi:hypothetical protein
MNLDLGTGYGGSLKVPEEVVDYTLGTLIQSVHLGRVQSANSTGSFIAM